MCYLALFGIFSWDKSYYIIIKKKKKKKEKKKETIHKFTLNIEILKILIYPEKNS